MGNSGQDHEQDEIESFVAAPDLRQWEPLERVGTAFDGIMHTVDVRRIATQRGRYNIPNLGLFLWRIDAYPLSKSPAVALDSRRWRFHPLGIDQPLYTRPQTIADFAQLSTPLNVPEPISRRVLDARLADYYTAADDATKSLRLYETLFRQLLYRSTSPRFGSAISTTTA